MTAVPAHIRKMAHDRAFKVTLRVGRSGLSDAMYDELDGQLKSRKVVKIKINKGLIEAREDRRALFEEIATRAKAILVDARGNVAILWRS
jgi:RNA-binding protein